MKRVLVLVLCAALMFSLAACGSTGSTSTAPASTPEASSTSTAEPAATGEKIKVGYDIYFLGNSWSVQLYQEFKWNAENKFADQIDVTYVESEGDISKQIANIEDLIAQEVDVIITTPNDTTDRRGQQRPDEKMDRAGQRRHRLRKAHLAVARRH